MFLTMTSDHRERNIHNGALAPIGWRSYRSKCRLSRGVTALVGVVMLFSGGCAQYQIGAASLYPQDVRTVYLPMIRSQSFRSGLGEQLTEAIAKQIEQQTNYKVVGNANADSVLSATIIEDRKRAAVESVNDDVREVETSIYVRVTWVKRNGQVLAENMMIPITPNLLSVTGTTSVVPETGQSIASGHQKAIQRIARQIVAMMEVPW